MSETEIEKVYTKLNEYVKKPDMSFFDVTLDVSGQHARNDEKYWLHKLILKIKNGDRLEVYEWEEKSDNAYYSNLTDWFDEFKKLGMETVECPECHIGYNEQNLGNRHIKRWLFNYNVKI